MVKMEKTATKLQQLVSLIEQHTPEEGSVNTAVPDFILFRDPSGHPRL